MSVAKKISEVMNKVNYLKKDGNVSFGRTNYNYLSEEKITSAMNEAFREAGLIIFPVNMELLAEKEVSTKSGKSYINRIKATYRIQDIEDNDYIEVQALGEGMDSGDKSINKAMTAAFKYVQRQSFMIPTGDDPDHISSEELTSKKQSAGNNGDLREGFDKWDEQHCKGCGKEVDDRVKSYSNSKYGKTLCRDCQT